MRASTVIRPRPKTHTVSVSATSDTNKNTSNYKLRHSSPTGRRSLSKNEDNKSNAYKQSGSLTSDQNDKNQK